MKKNIWEGVCIPISPIGKMTSTALKMLLVGHWLQFQNHECFQDYDKFYLESKKKTIIFKFINNLNLKFTYTKFSNLGALLNLLLM